MQLRSGCVCETLLSLKRGASRTLDLLVCVIVPEQATRRGRDKKRPMRVTMHFVSIQEHDMRV